jgi:serine/threonine-protein kinase
MTRRRRVRRLVSASLAAAGALTGVLFFHLVVMPLVVRHGNETTVPDIRGLELAESQALLDETDLRLGDLKRAFDDHIPGGRVLRQDPPMGFRVKKGREVNLVVSLGPEALRVPDLEGESLEHARFLLLREGLDLGKIRTVHGTEAARNCVVASSPRPGSPLGGRRSVDLLISLGPSGKRYLMPDLRGMEAAAVEALLIERGFQVRRRLWPGKWTGGDQVVEQTPPPGYPIEEGGTVEIITGR